MQSSSKDATKQRGKFIVFEGPDGFGKSTQARLAFKYLTEQREFDTALSKEPGSTLSTFTEDIREMLFHKTYSPTLDEVEQGLLFFIDHYRHAKQIEFNVSRGINVISDRWLYSQYAYDAIKPNPQIDAVALYEHYETLQIEPDLLLLFGLDKEEAYRRIKKREDSGEKKTLQSQKPWATGDYLGELIKQYANLYQDLVDRIPTVDIVPQAEEEADVVFEKYVKVQIDSLFEEGGE